MVLRDCTPWRGRAGAALFLLCFASPTWAEDAAPAAVAPPVCEGRDLSRDVALHPEDLARADARRHDQLTNGEGLLWRIEKSGAPASYLFGTLHSTDERAVALAKSAATHIAGAKVVATELGGPFDKLALAEMGGAMMGKALARDDDTLAGVQAPADVALIEKFLAGRGLNATIAHHIRGWFLALLTAAPLCEVKRQQLELPVVDEVIARTARDVGVRVVGLETVEEQIDVMASLDPKLTTTILISAARRPELIDDVYATMVSLYAQQKAAEILPVIDASQIMTPEESKAQEDFADRLLGARNKLMVARMKPLLEPGGAFVAVGALHLVGKGGLIALLRAEGFEVTKVP
jgi:uncharacterized protein YbaP (TraB family)